jgi:hypothetical protein
MTSQATSDSFRGSDGVAVRPIVLVLDHESCSVPTPILQAAHIAGVMHGLAVRLETRSYSALLRGARDEPPPLLGGVVLLNPPADVADWIRRWGIPRLPTSATGRELFAVTRDWMVAWSAEISAGPDQRAHETALSTPFRTFSLWAWELLTTPEQQACAARVRLDRELVQEALMGEHLFNQLPAGARLALAAELQVWDAQRLMLVSPPPPLDAFLPEEVEALDRACTIEGWNEADRALALHLGLRTKRSRHGADRSRRRKHEFVAYRATQAMLTTPDRWIALMERSDEART